MSLYMETTQIAASRTAAEIQQHLVEAGARRILMEYDKERKLVGLSFMLEIRGRDVPFTLPARSEPVFKALMRQASPKTRHRREADIREQSERVAWRQLLRWIQAQLAMIDTGMVEAGEVFMPYIQVAPGETFWTRAIAGGQLALPETTGEGNVVPFEKK